MKYAIAWPRPTKLKVESWSLPPEIEISVVETIDDRIVRDNGETTTIWFDAFLTDPASGQFFDLHVWAAYTFDSGTAVVTDVGCDVLSE
ncbi:MAG TPA: hypothetical protein VMV69_13065 [Pirellulales bacterium]|nr:hypothetical protein [Pirellulales bacterium]